MNCYLVRFLQKMVILQDLARFWQKFLQDEVSSCKILPDSGKTLQDNHSDPAWVLTVPRKAYASKPIQDGKQIVVAKFTEF